MTWTPLLRTLVGLLYAPGLDVGEAGDGVLVVDLNRAVLGVTAAVTLTLLDGAAALL